MSLFHYGACLETYTVEKCMLGSKYTLAVLQYSLAFEHTHSAEPGQPWHLLLIAFLASMKPKANVFRETVIGLVLVCDPLSLRTKPYPKFRCFNLD